MRSTFKSWILRKSWFPKKICFYILVEQERDVILRLNLVLEMSLETWANSQVWYTVCSREVVWPLVHKRAHRQWIFSQATSTPCFSFGLEQKSILCIWHLYGRMGCLHLNEIMRPSLQRATACSFCSLWGHIPTEIKSKQKLRQWLYFDRINSEYHTSFQKRSTKSLQPINNISWYVLIHTVKF